jgi:hypothetical protein
VLDINSEIDRLRTAKNYLYILTSVVYYVRVLIVEKLLSTTQRNKQTGKNCNCFLAKRQKFLANRLYSLISKIISLLIYSKLVALAASNLGNAY